MEEIKNRKYSDMKYKYQYPRAAFGHDFKEKHL